MIENYTLTRTVIHQFSVGPDPGVVEIYTPSLINNQPYYGYIEDLRVKIDIESLTEPELPDLDFNSSDTERFTALRNMEWGAQRMELALYLQVESGPEIEICRQSLINRLPYYQVNLLNLLGDNVAYGMGQGTKLKAAVLDVGAGWLTGADEVTIFGVAKEEAFHLPAYSVSSVSSLVMVSATGQQILGENITRAQATIVNTGENRVYLSYSSAPALGGIALLPNGGSYEINTTNPYYGPIAARTATGTSELSILEGSRV